MILQKILAFALLLECLCEYFIDIDVSDRAVIKLHTEVSKLLIQILDHSLSHLSLEVKHLRKPDAIDEVSDTLIDFSIK